MERILASGPKRLRNPSYRKAVDKFLTAAKASGQCPSLSGVQTLDQAQRQPEINQAQAELKKEQTQMAKVAQSLQQPPPNLQSPLPQMPAA